MRDTIILKSAQRPRELEKKPVFLEAIFSGPMRMVKTIYLKILSKTPRHLNDFQDVKYKSLGWITKLLQSEKIHMAMSFLNKYILKVYLVLSQWFAKFL